MHKKGFTVLELMIVIAIIGILVVAARPGLQDYLVRARLAQLMLVANQDKTALSTYYLGSGVMPENAAEAGLGDSAAQSKYIDAMRYRKQEERGELIYSLDAQALGASDASGEWIFEAQGSANGVQWSCHKGDFPIRYRPPACRSDASGG